MSKRVEKICTTTAIVGILNKNRVQKSRKKICTTTDNKLQTQFTEQTTDQRKENSAHTHLPAIKGRSENDQYRNYKNIS